VYIRLGINPGKGLSKLPEVVNIPESQQRFSGLSRELQAFAVEIQTGNYESGIFNSIKKIDILFKVSAQAGSSGEIRVWSYNQGVFAGV